MLENPEQFRLVVTGALAFGMILSLWWIVVLVWAGRRAARERQVQQRLGVIEGEQDDTRLLRLWHEGEEAKVFVPMGDRRPSLMQRLVQLPEHAGWKVPIQSVLLGLFGVATLLFLMALVLLKSLLVAICLVALVFVVFWIYTGQQLNKRINLFEQQLVDALELVARSLRAGHPLLGAFQMVSEELEAPIGPVFAEICQQQSLGVSLEEALQHAAESSPSDDMKLFATSVSIQLRSGGNLADMMDRLAEVIRQRIRLSRRVRVLTAQTQFSKRVLLALPFFVFVVLNILNAQYMGLLYSTTVGQILIAIAVISLAFGSWIMNRMATLRY